MLADPIPAQRRYWERRLVVCEHQLSTCIKAMLTSQYMVMNVQYWEAQRATAQQRLEELG